MAGNPTTAIAAAVRADLILTINDTPTGHLSKAAWSRVLKALEREIAKEIAANGHT